MRTNIDIDDKLIEEALRLSGLRTKKAVVDKALETFIRCAREREALGMFGKLQWEGDLAASREGRIDAPPAEASTPTLPRQGKPGTRAGGVSGRRPANGRRG
jgi:Arc/MetJ family transcription regulator